MIEKFFGGCQSEKNKINEIIDGYNNSVVIGNLFQITNSNENLQTDIADMSNTSATFLNNILLCRIRPPLGSTTNYGSSMRNGLFGPSNIYNPNIFPFHINNVLIGSSETTPTATEGISEGSLCLASVNIGLTWGWVFKSGQWRALQYTE